MRCADAGTSTIASAPPPDEGVCHPQLWAMAFGHSIWKHCSGSWRPLELTTTGPDGKQLGTSSRKKDQLASDVRVQGSCEQTETDRSRVDRRRYDDVTAGASKRQSSL